MQGRPFCVDSENTKGTSPANFKHTLSSSAIILDLPEVVEPCLYELVYVRFDNPQQAVQHTLGHLRFVVSKKGLSRTGDPDLRCVTGRPSLDNMHVNRLKRVSFV